MTSNQKVAEKARKNLEASLEGSTILNEEREARYPRFRLQEVSLGKVLGRGGFCVVNEIQEFNLNDDFLNEEATKNNLSLPDQKEHRQELHSRVRRGEEQRYAIKKLSEDLYSDEETLIKGLADLAIEAKFLSVLEHPHIIKMRGVGIGDSCSPDFFIILDKLYDSFNRKLQKWKSTEKKLSGVMSKLKDKGGKKKNEFLASKLNCAYDLASALTFFHDHDIIYRDFKPDNIGFDVRDEPKIFDLGLAKQLQPEKQLEDGNYKLTGWTGSVKYMAPEVANMMPYNFSVDVYSFGLVLWQILSCEEPYYKFTLRMIETYVIRDGIRPKVNPKWKRSLRELITNCWDPISNKRPNFEQVMKYLREEIYFLQDDACDLDLDASMMSRNGKK